ncbi:unnamed protein product [Triticum turgidum subsp. durum]|uniref:AP2/ERF domain-containing protein n=1 Tax=Triticum turgidum subsp. durum TaxID=4567 RepID=A0A9R0XVR1_TRITD|nr:unnamed protein product [Triticum turgidum subsp. durum]
MAKQRRSGAGAGNVASDAVRPKPERTRRSVRRGRPSQRTSSYRGVTRHRWTGRFEAHLWEKNTWTEPQRKKKGRQVYLGAYGGEEAAARAYDLAALKYWGRGTVLNFSLSSYGQELKEMRRSPGRSTSARSGGTQITPIFGKWFCLLSDQTAWQNEKHWLLKRGVQVQRRRRVELIFHCKICTEHFSDSCKKNSARITTTANGRLGLGVCLATSIST